MQLAKLADLLRIGRDYRAGLPLGDLVVRKLDALGSPPGGMAERLAPVRDFAPRLDLPALRGLPAGTLGREYARFLDANHIIPLAISDATRERFRDDPFALRYTTTHDLHHTLTGFDAGLAGEIGVLAFNVGQTAAPIRGFMLWFACVLYGLVSPTQLFRVWHNARVGLAMGKKASLVMADRLESRFEETLDAVRARLAIPDPVAAGVLPSRSSVVMMLLAPSYGQVAEARSTR